MNSMMKIEKKSFFAHRLLESSPFRPCSDLFTPFGEREWDTSHNDGNTGQKGSCPPITKTMKHLSYRIN